MPGASPLASNCFAVDRFVEVREKFVVVRDSQQRRAVTSNVIEQDLQHLRFVRGIEIAGWFVAQQQRRLQQQRSTDRHTLPFALR